MRVARLAFFFFSPEVKEIEFSSLDTSCALKDTSVSISSTCQNKQYFIRLISALNLKKRRLSFQVVT